MSGKQEIPDTTRVQHKLVGRSLQEGTYQVEAVIGHGGMGEVFLASHRALDVPVALKQARADQSLPKSVIIELDNLLHQKQTTPRTPVQLRLADDFPVSGGINTDRFLREALLLARLCHPAIPTLYDYFLEDGYWYLVMEYLPGPTLANYINQYAPLPPLEALNYAMQLCDVLDYLHQQAPQIVFRDLKPSNVILSPEGRLMLVDFGIARYFKEGQITDTTDFGSPGYASPEQFEGSVQTDGRSDLYSLGVILHEMISGQRPGRAGAGTRAGKLESPRQINPALSPALSGLVTVATRAEAMYRFQSAHAFYIALERTRDIEERRAFKRLELLSGDEQTNQLQPATAQVSTTRPVSHTKSQLTASRIHQAHARDNLNKARRERLEQEALAIQLASIDESLKQRTATPIMPTPTGDERTFPAPRARRPRRLLPVLLVVSLLLSIVLTSFFATHYYSTHRPSTVTSGVKHIIAPTLTPSPEVAPQMSWQSLPSLPSPEADNTASFVSVQGKGYIYVSGGFRGAGERPLYSRGLYRYDIAAAHWESTTNTSFPAMGNNATAVDSNSSIFFTGGFSFDTGKITQALYMYSPTRGALQKIFPPLQAFIGFGNAMFDDQAGHLYITEGFSTPGNLRAQAGTGWYRYDIHTSTWEILTPLPTGLGYVTLAPDGQGGILLIGGSKDEGQFQPSARIYRYDTSRNIWTLEPTSVPQPISGATSCLDGQNRLVILGGYDAVHASARATAWLVTLNTLNWAALPTLPGGSQLGAAACDGSGHVFLERGGNNSGRPTADFLELTLQSYS